VKKWLIFLLVLILIVFVAGFAFFQGNREAKETESKTKIEKKEKSMTITSPAFGNNQKIPGKYTCDGENISPPLEFSDIPKNAQSLVLIADDPDAPSKTWVHWIVYNIDPSTKKVEENSVPQSGIQGMTDFGEEGYGGPCPPPALQNRDESGTHRYFFKLYALDRMLDVPEGLAKQQILEKMDGLVADEAELVGLYSRK